MKFLKSKKHLISVHISVMLVMLITLVGINHACKQSNIVISANATPMSNKVIVLDAGHGLPDERSNRIYGNNRTSYKSGNSLKITEPYRTKRSEGSSY